MNVAKQWRPKYRSSNWNKKNKQKTSEKIKRRIGGKINGIKKEEESRWKISERDFDTRGNEWKKKKKRPVSVTNESVGISLDATCKWTCLTCHERRMTDRCRNRRVNWWNSESGISNVYTANISTIFPRRRALLNTPFARNRAIINTKLSEWTSLDGRSAVVA